MDFDLGRMFFGDFSWAFTFEIVLRTTIMYAYTLLVIRVIGKRGLGNLSPFELVIIVALGSSVGDPMFYDDVPLIDGMIVITVVVALQRTLLEVAGRSPRIEGILESKARRLVTDGAVDHDALDNEEITESELFSALREKEIEHLGQVERAYIEPSGVITVFRADKPRKGRSVFPEDQVPPRVE